MKLSSQIKPIPISYLKAHAAEIVSRLSENQDVIVITRNGEAKAVIRGIESFENTQETLALLKISPLETPRSSRERFNGPLTSSRKSENYGDISLN